MAFNEKNHFYLTAFQERIIFYLTAKQFDCADLEYFKEETDADNEQGLAVTLSRPVSVAYFLFFILFFSSAFLRRLLPCVRTNDLAYVRHTSEGARTVCLGPIYSDLCDPFATLEMRLLSVRCRLFLFSHLIFERRALYFI